MGVSGALVWCVTNDAWIPFRLDAVKLSGTITKAHWESVAELIRLLATNQLVLRAGASSDSLAADSVPVSAVVGHNGDADNYADKENKSGSGDDTSESTVETTTAAASILTLLEDAAAAAANREDTGQNSSHNGGNVGDKAAEMAAKSAPIAPATASSQGKVLPAAFGRFYACNVDNGRSVLSLDSGDRAKRVMAATNMEAITFNVTTKSLDSLLSSIQQRDSSSKLTASPPESVRSDPSAAKRSSPIILSVSSSSLPPSRATSTSSMPTLSPSSSTSSLFEEQRTQRTTSRRHSVALFEPPLLESSEDENSSQCTASSGESRCSGAGPKESSEEATTNSYVPQETPTWLKLLQRYHDSKRLEKQIQRQREAWARNKRNLRRESVPKCVSGLSR